MEILSIPYEAVPQLSLKDTAYATAHPALRPFYKYEVGAEAFAQVLADKQKDTTDRQALVEVLREQYETLDPSQEVLDNIEALLDPATFTVATAHQPCLFTGPLYYVYKIVSTINLAEQLNARYPGHRFVPVFVNGGEDHDFEEVNHANLFGKRITWECGERGSVGMMKTESLQSVLEELSAVLGDSEAARQIAGLFRKVYTRHEQYGDAVNDLINELFKSYGLVVINMNHARLKRLFIPVMRRELTEQPSKQLVESTTAQLEAAGFSGQAHARDINLFYLREQLRERIVQENGHYRVIDTSYKFTREELLAELEAHPEHFSPNVVLRPLFQELILPNLAYVGGGGEIAYWLERRRQFEYFGINFPMLVRRNSVLWIDQGSAKRMEKLELSVQDLFQDAEELVKQYVRKNTANEISLSQEKNQLQDLFESAIAKAQEVDKTLVKTAQAEMAKALNSLEVLEGKLLRAEKQRHEIAIGQIRALKDKLFPGGGLQERHDNFLSLYLRYEGTLFGILKDCLDPLKRGIIIVVDR